MFNVLGMCIIKKKKMDNRRLLVSPVRHSKRCISQSKRAANLHRSEEQILLPRQGEHESACVLPRFLKILKKALLCKK